MAELQQKIKIAGRWRRLTLDVFFSEGGSTSLLLPIFVSMYTPHYFFCLICNRFAVFFVYLHAEYKTDANMSSQMIQQTIADYFKTQPVLKAWLFGSFARGEETPQSDVDILFVPDRSGKPFTLFTMGGMYMDLKELLGREVDLVEEGSLRPYAAETANRDKKLIYERKSEG